MYELSYVGQCSFSYSRLSLFSFIHILGFPILGFYSSQCIPILGVFNSHIFISSGLFPIAGVSVSYSRLIFIGLWNLLYWSMCLFLAYVIVYEVVIWLGEFKYGMYL